MSDSARYLKPKQQSFGEFVWNSEKSEFFGRTGSSWGEFEEKSVICYAAIVAIAPGLVYVQQISAKPFAVTLLSPKYIYNLIVIRIVGMIHSEDIMQFYEI